VVHTTPNGGTEHLGQRGRTARIATTFALDGAWNVPAASRVIVEGATPAASAILERVNPAASNRAIHRFAWRIWSSLARMAEGRCLGTRKDYDERRKIMILRGEKKVG
jgi:hypothetical protein